MAGFLLVKTPKLTTAAEIFHSDWSLPTIWKQ